MSWWFGASWGAPVCEPQRHVPTPVGRVCVECDTSIVDDDTGFVMPFVTRSNTTEDVVYHRVCFLRTVIPCAMWDAELTTDMPDRWRRHREERHPE